MGMAEGPTDEGGRRRVDTPIERYLNAFAELAQSYGEKAASLAPDPDVKPLITHYTSVLGDQIGRLSRELADAYRGAGQDTQAEVNWILEMTAAHSLATGAIKPVAQTRSVAGFAGLGGVFELVKKIIKFIAEKLGLRIPDFITNLLDLLDELLRAMTEPVSELGATRLHRNSIRHLDAQVQIARLHHATHLRTNDSDAANGG